MRTIVEIPDEELRELTEICQREGISRAEAVRRAIRDYIAQDEAAFDEAFGSWKEHAEDGVELQRRLRAEWDDRDSGL
jgi:hypothetical protein